MFSHPPTSEAKEQAMHDLPGGLPFPLFNQRGRDYVRQRTMTLSELLAQMKKPVMR